MGQTYRQTHIWDRHTSGTDTHLGQTHTPMKNSLHAKEIFVCGRISVQIVLKHPPWLGDSKNVLRFNTGCGEVTFFWEQTNKHPDKVLYYID